MLWIVLQVMYIAILVLVMSDAKEMAMKASEWIETLIAEMLEGNHQDNQIVLGELSSQSGNENIQVRLFVTRNESDFIDE